MPRIIDTHMHIFTKDEYKCMNKFWKPLFSYLYHKEIKTEEEVRDFFPTEEELVEMYRKAGAVAMPTAWDAETATGDPPTTNDKVAELVKKYPDVFITGWAMVDPWKGVKALEEIERAIKELKLIGVKFQQTAQAFHVNDRHFYPMWDLIQDLGVPVQLHGGYTGLGVGMPGALGVKLTYNRIFPDMEDLAVDFPKIKIIILHVCDPWVEEAIALARHKGNVFRECSGMWPKYFPEPMVYDMNRRLKEKFMFGTDVPLFNLEELIKQHEEMNYRPGVLENLFWKNTIRILGEDLERVGVNIREWE